MNFGRCRFFLSDVVPPPSTECDRLSGVCAQRADEPVRSILRQLTLTRVHGAACADDSVGQIPPSTIAAVHVTPVLPYTHDNGRRRVGSNREVERSDDLQAPWRSSAPITSSSTRRAQGSAPIRAAFSVPTAHPGDGPSCAVSPDDFTAAC